MHDVARVFQSYTVNATVGRAIIRLARTTSTARRTARYGLVTDVALVTPVTDLCKNG